MLRRHEAVLREMAGREEKARNEALAKAFAILADSVQQSELRDLDLTKRSAPWVVDPDACTVTCDQPPNRATVMPTESHVFWHCCIEQPDRFKRWSPRFGKLDTALGWAEQELQSIGEQAAQAETHAGALAQSPFQQAFVPGPHLEPYRIEPAALEPTRITYRIAIDLEYAPYTFKTWELSFGKLRRYDERYHTPGALAREVRLDESQVGIEQPLAPDDGLYRVRSHVTYYYADIAQRQAQQLWDRSAIVQRYREGKVVWARYGVQEVETNYTTWLGGCEAVDQPWAQAQSRAEYMQNWATRLTLIHAADLDDLRSFVAMSESDISDERLLFHLHRLRARSSHIPDAARAESERWLREHKTADD